MQICIVALTEKKINSFFQKIREIGIVFPETQKIGRRAGKTHKIWRKTEGSGVKIRRTDLALEARELIKVTVQKNAPLDAREACAELCERVHAEPVQTIGSRFVIYRQARENSRIRLEDL